MTDNTQAYDGHHKISNERAWELEHEEMFGRGAGDPDVYGYPGEPSEIKQVTAKKNYTMEDALNDCPF